MHTDTVLSPLQCYKSALTVSVWFLAGLEKRLPRLFFSAECHNYNFALLSVVSDVYYL